MKKDRNRYTANLRMESLEAACIVVVEREYSRTTSGKSWKAKPDRSETRQITAQNYFNYCDSIPFFKNLGGSETCDFGYTYVDISPLKSAALPRIGARRLCGGSTSWTAPKPPGTLTSWLSNPIT